MDTYDENLDREYLTSRGVTIIEHRPWQFGLLYTGLSGKFVWYPKKGTLMYERSAYDIHKVGEFFSTEEVWEQILEKAEKRS